MVSIYFRSILDRFSRVEKNDRGLKKWLNDGWMVTGWMPSQSQDGLISPSMAQLVPVWPSQSQYGLVSPSMAQLVPVWPSQSQYGLVSPRVAQLVPGWPICGRPRGKMYFFSLGRSNWLQITKNRFLRFLAFYPLISAFQAFQCIANDRA